MCMAYRKATHIKQQKNFIVDKPIIHIFIISTSLEVMNKYGSFAIAERRRDASRH